MALRPRRSSLVTTRTSPGSGLPASLANSGRWLMATLPEMVSVTMRCGSTRKPEAVISCTWFSVVYSGVEALRFAKVRAIALPVHKRCPHHIPVRNGLMPVYGQGCRGVTLTAVVCHKNFSGLSQMTSVGTNNCASKVRPDGSVSTDPCGRTISILQCTIVGHS